MKRLIPVHQTNIPHAHPGVMIERSLKAQGVSEEDFAKSCGLPIDTIRKIITGTTDVDGETIEKMKKFFGDDIDVIIHSRDAFEYQRQHGQRLPPQNMSSAPQP